MTAAPLPVQLSRVLADLDAQYREDASAPSPEMGWGLLRVLSPDPVDLKQLPTLARLSRRAVRQGINAATRHGFVGPDARLTPAGQEARERWSVLGRRLDGQHPGLTQALTGVVEQFDLELPHYPISYGSADPRITGGNFRPGGDGVPPHGQDWIPVRRAKDDRAKGESTDGLGLVALASQALVGFTISYETRGTRSMLMCTYLAVGFADDDEAGVVDLPAVLEITGSGRSGLERHGVVTVKGGKGGIARLTAVGRALRDQHHDVVAQVEGEWSRRYQTTQLRRALEDAQPKSAVQHFLKTTIT